MKLRIFYLTSRGRLRHTNEDALLLPGRVVSGLSMDAPAGEEFTGEPPVLFAVADGMGGLPCGEVASRLTLEYLKDRKITSPEDIQRELAKAKEFLDAYVERESRCRGMGTAVAGVSLTDRGALVFNVGDCRVYLRRDRLLRLTEDHTEAYELFRRGAIGEEDLREHPLRNLLTSALMGGYPDELLIYTRPVDVREGDLLLLCSDGLWGEMSLKEMEDCTSLREEEGAECLFGKAYRGGSDNISFILIRVLGG